MIRVFATGDVMGKAGREVLGELLPIAKKKFNPTFFMINGENAAGGHGISKKIYDYFLNHLGVDCITMGNHWHDHNEVFGILKSEDCRIVLPANMSNVNDESLGIKEFRDSNQEKLVVCNLVGRAFMRGDNRCPFQTLENLGPRFSALDKVRILDIHAEASSEKQALAQHLKNSFSLVYGTHSHVPSADERILNQRMGFLTDIGLTGSYDSVIGMDSNAAIHRIRTGEKKNFKPAEKEPWMCFIIADIDEKSGNCLDLKRYRWELKQIDFLNG